MVVSATGLAISQLVKYIARFGWKNKEVNSLRLFLVFLLDLIVPMGLGITALIMTWAF